jgi:copper transport protein
MATMRLAALAAALVTAAVLAPGAFAHATLLHTEPRDGAVLPESPPQVRVTFSDSVSIAGGNEVVRNTGGSVLAGKPRLTARGRTLVLPLRSRLPRGDYSVRWKIVSDDGHPEQGVLAFRIGRTGAAAPHSVLRAGGGTSASTVVSRWIFFVGLLAAGGAGLFLLLVGRGRVGPRELRRTSGLLALGLLGAFLGGSTLLHESGAGTGTRAGRVLEVALVVALCGATAAVAARVYPRLLLPAALAAIALLAAPPLMGHALDPGRPRALELTADFLHVASAAFWIGGVAELALLLPGLGSTVARRFSTLALPALGLLAATGVVRALGELSTVSQLWSTGYGRAIVAKTILFALLIGLGLRSRTLLARLPSLRQNVLAEAGVLALVVVAIAVLTAGRPGRAEPAAAPTRAPPETGAPAARPPAPPADATVLPGRAGDLALGLAVRPGKPLGLQLTALAPSGGTARGLTVRLAGTAARPCGPGCYAAQLPGRPQRIAVSIAGHPPATFELPRSWPAPSGTVLVARATRVFRSQRSVTYEERLGSGTGEELRTRWTLEAPNRLSYAIAGGASAVVIGTSRWDRTAPGKPWTRSDTTLLRQPTPFWSGAPITNAHMLGERDGTAIVSFATPAIPAFFSATFDRRTGRTLALDMVAASHFMHHRYLPPSAAVRITPPR